MWEITRHLVEFVSELDYDDIQPGGIVRAKLLMRDLVGRHAGTSRSRLDTRYDEGHGSSALSSPHVWALPMKHYRTRQS